MTDRHVEISTGLIGLLAAALVGAGEFMLHFDPLGRYGQGFDFLKGEPNPEQRPVTFSASSAHRFMWWVRGTST